MNNLRFFLIVLVVLFMSCSNDVNIDFPGTNFPPGTNNCILGQGSITSESRTLANFNSINTTIFAEILLTQGPLADVVIEGQQNIIDQILTEVVNNELRITLNRCVNIAQAVKVHITIPEISKLTLTGSGDIIAQNDFDLSDLNVTLTGAGNFNLRGMSTNLDVILTGVGDVNAFDLETDVCDVRITGVGDTEVFVNNELNVTITGTGSVYYKGSPSITSSITGVGSVIDAN